MDILAYFEEGIKGIKTFIKKNELRKAYLSCQELLRLDPYNKKLLNLQGKVEKKIIKTNLTAVKTEINKTWKLWDEKRYEELIQIYSKLLEFAPQYKRIYKLIEKANLKMGKNERGRRETFIAQAISAIEKSLNEKRFGEAMQASEELLTLDPQNMKAKTFLKKARENIIEEKLKENEKIVDSGQYERALELYESLLKIDPGSDKVQKMLADARKHITQKGELEQKIQINEGVKRLQALFDSQEYEKVIEASEDILKIDSRNISAKIYKQKAENTIRKEIDTAVLKKISVSIPAMREEFKKTPQSFIRI